jgi:hypothetical protein
MAAGPTFPGPKPCPLDHAPVTHDPVDLAEIGYGLAAARALSRLAKELLRTANADVQGLLHDLHRS